MQSNISNHNNWRYLVYIFLLSSFAFSQTLSAQIPKTIVHIEGIVKEKLGTKEKNIPRVKIRIQDKSCFTNELGGFYFENVPVRENKLSIELNDSRYRILNPISGFLDITTQDKTVKVKVIVIDEVMHTKVVKKAEALEQELSASNMAHQMTQGQLDDLKQTKIDTIAYYENINNDYVQKINLLEQELNTTQDINVKLKEEVRLSKEALIRFEKKVTLLMEDLRVALEEKYLQQKQCFDTLSIHLNEYVIRAKDAGDLLPKIKEYFPVNYNQRRENVYSETLKAYNDIYLIINNNEEEYKKNITHYWTDDPLALSKYNHAINLLTEKIHQTIIQPTFKTINSQLRIGKRKRAANIGVKAENTFNEKIKELEQTINELTDYLQINF